MASEDALGSPDDGLELERIAVGPYCVFDDFRLPPSPPTAMEDPMMASNFPFGNMRDPPWQVHDDLGWTDWMAYDPSVASQNPQSVEPKPAADQGSAAFLKPAQQQSPLAAHHPQSQPIQPTSTPTTAPMFAHASAVPFTFGQSADMSPAFDFAGHPLSSPLTGDSTRQNSFLSPPIWQQQQQQQQPPPQQQQQHLSQHQRHIADNAAFNTTKYSQPAFAAPPPHHSPTSIHNGRASSSSSHSSPEPPVSSKKRKMSSDEDDLDSPSLTKKEKGQPPKKTAHNMIEKRYRTNLNDKIAALRDSVPSLRVMSRPNGTEEDDDPEDLEGLTPAHKLNKATVLSKATEYIRHLEKRNKRMGDEITALQARLDSYEKMAMTGQMNMHGSRTSPPDGSRYQEDPFAPAHGMPMHGQTQGMIPVPENIAALRRGLPPQQHYAPAYPQYANNARPTTGPPMVNARQASGMVGKLMVGSLAGLMVLEGVVEHKQSQGAPADRGLFAFPIHLATSILAPRASFGVSATHIPLAKLVLVFGAVFWLIAPWLNPKAKPKKKKTSTAIQLKPAPSIASPLEVRRKAWLTAIQTVWVPQHNFVLEVAALGLKTLKLSTRKIIGWPGYAYLTGLTKEQEDARVKAWEIALDAQLTGGDAEISKSRLLLTLLASGTLPDTPARLMLKALHIRVLLWEIANTGHGSWWTVDDLSAKLARSYWNMARSEHRIASNMASKQEKQMEPLPEHLAALIEKECDDVLIPAIVQRAYNLAWNPAGNEKTAIDISMDSVVEDSAISSPLDAVAAWYSGVVLKKALASTLATKKSGSPKDSVVSDLALALQSAPPNSQAQLRALVAQAVVLDDNRFERIGLAIKALPSDPRSTDIGFMNLVGTTSVASDICDALTMAKCLSLLELSSSTARLRAIFCLNRFYLCESTTTLLSFVAGHKVLTHFMQEASLQTETSTGLERLASSLRMWVGHGTGKRSGLSNKVRSKIVERCLNASKTLVGLAEKKDDAYIDDGYASASVKDD